MKKTKEQERIEFLEKKIDDLNLKQQCIYDFAKFIGERYANSSDVYELQRNVKELEEKLSKSELTKPKPKYYNPHGWNFHASFVPALLVFIIFLLAIIMNKLPY